MTKVHVKSRTEEAKLERRLGQTVTPEVHHGPPCSPQATINPSQPPRTHTHARAHRHTHTNHSSVSSSLKQEQKCFKRGDGNRARVSREMRLSSGKKKKSQRRDRECLMHQCTKSDILLQLEGFQKLLEKAGKCV